MKPRTKGRIRRDRAGATSILPPFSWSIPGCLMLAADAGMVARGMVERGGGCRIQGRMRL